MKKTVLFISLSLMISTAFAQNEVEKMLNRFLSYVSIESQSIEESNQESFPLTESQKTMARRVFNDIKSIGKGVEVYLDSDYYYVYVKVPANHKKSVPSVCFMAHLDITFEIKGIGIKPQVHRNYNGEDIVLGNGLVLSPNSVEGMHLRDLVGKTIVTTDGSTLLGADCKAGCGILVTLIEDLANDKKMKHGDVYFVFAQNEETGKAAVHMDMKYFDKKPDILIDVDGDVYGTYSVQNFTAVNRIYYFDGNKVISSHGKENRYADAYTAAAFFIGQLPPEIHPSYSEGRQGYVHCYKMEKIDSLDDMRLFFRIRYFDKSDGERYLAYLDNAFQKTIEAFPFVQATLEESFKQYDNVAYNMHPSAMEAVQRAAKRCGIEMKPVELRAGTTGALMVAQGMPGGPCIYSGQNAVHSVYEWCCIEELVALTKLCKEIVLEVNVIK